MPMAFSSLGEIRVTILFKWWRTNNIAEYIVTLLAIIAMGIVFQGIRSAHVKMALKRERSVRHLADSSVNIDSYMVQPLTNRELETEKSSECILALLGAASYGFGLLLMLIVSGPPLHIKYSLYANRFMAPRSDPKVS